MKNQDYEKISASLRGWLLGQGFYDAVKAMEFARKLHDGFRRDKVTPEFQHQIEIANFARTLNPHFIYPGTLYATVMLHDVKEDKGISDDRLLDLVRQDVIDAVELLTNQYPDKIRKDPKQMFEKMALNPVSSIVKGIDRIHNSQSMIGVFSPTKQLSYIEETETYILPMLKEARKNFPQQEMAYHNIRHVLMSQIELLRAVDEERNKHAQSQG